MITDLDIDSPELSEKLMNYIIALTNIIFDEPIAFNAHFLNILFKEISIIKQKSLKGLALLCESNVFFQMLMIL